MSVKHFYFAYKLIFACYSKEVMSKIYEVIEVSYEKNLLIVILKSPSVARA